MRPLVFLSAMNRIRGEYLADPELSTDLYGLAARVDTDVSVCAAVVAALVNQGMLKWSHEGAVVRGDVPDTVRRRTA